MCGFVAVLGPGEPLPSPVIERMSDTIAHRGPDGAGAWRGQHAKGSIALGFRRLAIVDTRNLANQPMVSRDGRTVLVFNGEIYNFVELRAELEAVGRKFRSRCDTEVLLQGYQQWGESVVERLNGMFAFIIWDEVREQIFVARDRFGEKPLFVCGLPNNQMAFASEIKALLVHPECALSYDLDMFGKVLAGHLIFGGEDTLFSGVSQFPASHCMTLTMSGELIRKRRYWTPVYDRSLSNLDKHDLSTLVYDHLERSLKMRMRSDVPVTACLSGGLDSSTLTAILASIEEDDGKYLRSAISVRFPEDPTIDEGHFIDMVLAHTGLEGHSVSPTVEQLTADLRKMHWHHETIIPGPSMYLEWSLMREARELGYKVILDGQGADEIFAGYACYLQAYQAELSFSSPLGVFSAVRLGKMRDARLRRASKLYQNASRRFSLSESLGLKQIYDYQKHLVPLRIQEYGKDVLPALKDVGLLRFELALNLLRTSLPSNLYSGDRNSMAHGIECRYPFLDYELVDTSTRLSDAAYLKDAWGKAILRETTTKILPPEITWRADKVGFAAPQDRWMNSSHVESWLSDRLFDSSLKQVPGYNRDFIEKSFALHKNQVADHSSILWTWASASELLDMKRTGYWENTSMN